MKSTETTKVHKYETHAHTSETSRCSRINGVDLVRYYHSMGYAGVCITDHFFNGNTTVPRDVPWDERVELFAAGYENAAREGSALGISVFFGWEYTYRGADFLTYGLDKDWLLSNPDLLEWSVNDYLDRVRADGGFVAHAHPFREAAYIPMIHLLPRKVDAVEVYNTSMPDETNDFALWYANSYDLQLFAGSDTHSDTRTRFGGIKIEAKKGFDCVSDMVKTLKAGKYEIFHD